MTALQSIKLAFENREALLFLINDKRTQKIMVAWTLYFAKEPTFTHIEPLGNPQATLDLLWDDVGDVDFARLSEIADVPLTKAVDVFERLRAARLVFPDGTIPEGAMRIVRAEVGAYVAALMPRGTYGRTHERGTSFPEPSLKGLPTRPAPQPGTDSLRRGGAVEIPS
jgi:hypothetical protein